MAGEPWGVSTKKSIASNTLRFEQVGILLGQGFGEVQAGELGGAARIKFVEVLLDQLFELARADCGHNQCAGFPLVLFSERAVSCSALFLAILQNSWLISIPTKSRLFFTQATAVVPEPMNGSKTTSPGFVNNLMNHSGRATGNVALWPLFAHSVAM